MRRNSQIFDPNIGLSKKKRQRTYIEKDVKQSNNSNNSGQQYNYITCLGIVKKIVQQTLMERIQQEIKKIEIKNLINQTLDECTTLINQQTWHMQPNCPFTQRLRQAPLKIDQEPATRHYDAQAAFKNPKISNDKQTAESQLSISKLKSQTKMDQSKGKQCKFENRNSTRTKKSGLPKQGVCFETSKLIPLEIKILNTPECSYRRNFEDFLRDKKYNAEINLGYKIKYIQTDKENFKVFQQQLPKTSVVLAPVKIEASILQNQFKLPIITQKDDCATDYDGESISLNKQALLKLPSQAEKATCKITKIKSSTLDKIKSKAIKLLKFEKINHKIKKHKLDSSNIAILSLRQNTEREIKYKIEQSLHSNRLKFRSLNPVREYF